MRFGGNLLLWGCMLWLPVLIYFLMRNEAKPKKNIIVGVTLPYEARQDPAVLEVLDRFKREAKLTCVLVLLPAIPGCFIRSFGLSMTVWLTWVVAVCVVVNIPYIRCNRALHRLKLERGWRREPSAQPLPEPREALELKWLSPLLFLPPLLVSLIPLLFDRELWAVWLVDAALVVLFYACYRWLYRNKSEMVDGDADRTVALTRMRRYHWGRCWLVMAWATGLFDLGLWLTMDHLWWQMAVILVYSVGICVEAIGVEFRIRRQQEKLTAGGSREDYVDEDDHWIWGMFYYNPNDAKLIVNARVGMNTTINLAKRSGQVLMVLTMALLLGCPLMGLWFMDMERAPVELAVTEEAVVASHHGTEYRVALEDVDTVELLEELPPMRRVSGTGLDSARTGKFSSDAWGRFTCCVDPRTGPWLLIREEDGDLFLFGGTQNTAEVFQRIAPK